MIAGDDQCRAGLPRWFVVLIKGLAADAAQALAGRAIGWLPLLRRDIVRHPGRCEHQ